MTQPEHNLAGLAASAAVPATTGADARRWWVLAACSAVIFSRLIAPPLWALAPPTLVQAFGAESDIFRFYSSLSALPQFIFLMIGGVMGDLFGRRRVLLIGMGGYVALNVLCLLAPGPVWLLVFRAAGGWCSALAAPLALATVRLSFDERELPLAILCYTGALSVASLLSPLLGFLLDEPWGWRAMYVTPVVAAAIATLMVLRHLNDSKVHGTSSRVDSVGTATWAAVMLALFFAIVAAQSPSGWAWQIALGALAIGLAGCGWLLWYELHVLRKSVRRAPYRKRALTVVLIAGALMNMVLVGYFLQLWGFFGTARQYSPVLAVLALAPAIPAIGLVVALLAWVQRRFDARVSISAGLLVMAAAAGLTALGASWAPYWWFVVPMMLLMIGYMVVATAWTTVFFLAVQRDFAGVNAAINNGAGLIGSVLGAMLLGSLLVFFGRADFTRRLELVGVPQTLAERALGALDYALRLDHGRLDGLARPLIDAMLSAYRQSYAVAFGQVLGLLAALCLACAAFVWFGLRRSDTIASS